MRAGDHLIEFEKLFKAQQFFEAHEWLESVWLRAPQEEKPFFQALIQVAVAMHHRRENNPNGAQTCLRRAEAKLEGVNPEIIPDYIQKALQILKK